MGDISFTVEPAEAGKRLDVFLADRLPELTRSQAERLAKSGQVLIDGRPALPGRRVEAGEIVQASVPAPVAPEPQPERVPLEILFEDDDVIVVNKPRGMVVHPAAGRTSGTLVNALLAHTKDLAAGSGSYRPGIVHRLDRDTSGLLVVAKTDSAYAGLSRQVRKHEMDRRYLALVWGDVREDRLVIDVPIGRHERERTRMEAVVGPAKGRTIRAAHTDVSVLQRFGGMTLVEALLGTGRTHQIRVHLAHIGHPVVGDPVYGLRQARRQKAALPADVLKLVQQLGGSPKESGSPRAESRGGQALHAHHLRFRHPSTDQEMTFTAPMPPDMARLVSHLSAPARSR